MQPPTAIIKRWVWQLFVLQLCLTASLAANADWTSLTIFNGSVRNWTSSDGTTVKSHQALYGNSPGVSADLAMQHDQERIYIDHPLNLDLSSITEYSLAIRISNPPAVSRVSLYFKSGAGWYGGWFKVSGSEWQTITLPRSVFGAEGSPTGWSAINGIRIAFWKEQPQQTRIELAAIRGRSSPISILRNRAAAKSLPNEMTFINRSTDRLAQWFERVGLHPEIIDDESLMTDGIPTNCRLLILPFNPVVTPTVHQALLAFSQRGGKLIVIYGLTDELAPIIGLKGKRWLSADPPDSLATIKIDTGAVSGTPSVIRQDSWNANIPQPERARVIGTWQRANGQDSGLPAMTIDKNGAFVGHVLTNIDRERKMQLLIALIAKLVPDLAPLLSNQLWLQAQQLFEFENWEQTRAYIAKEAVRHGQSIRILKMLQAIDRIRENHPITTGTTPFAQSIESATHLRDQIRQAYFMAVSPRRNKIEKEFRGVWCHHAAGPSGHTWSSAISHLKQAGFNALFANHLWAGVAYYPSDVLPVSPLVSSQGDLLKDCLSACKREGVALHLWSVLWVLDNAPESFVKQMEQDGRLAQDSKGKLLTWLCPANPLNVALATKAAVESVQRYAVDGFHLDYIRYPDRDACFCKHCASRFRKETGRAARNWPQDVITGSDREPFLSWRRDRITAALSQIRDAVKAVRPSVQVSAAVWGNWPGVRDSIGQDWVKWCRDGKLDFVTPMNYVNTAAEARDLYKRQRLALPKGFTIYPGISPTTYNLPPEETVRQVDALREQGADGFVLFELDPDLINVHLPALRVGATSR